MDGYTGAAWLSSARAVRCSVKSGNERNPCYQLPASKVGDSGETACVKQDQLKRGRARNWNQDAWLQSCPLATLLQVIPYPLTQISAGVKAPSSPPRVFPNPLAKPSYQFTH